MQRQLTEDGTPSELYLDEIHVLALAYRSEAGVSSPDLIDVLGEQHKSRFVMHRRLSRLSKFGLLHSDSERTQQTPSGRYAKLYHLTEKGQERLFQESQKLQSILEVVGVTVVPTAEIE